MPLSELYRMAKSNLDSNATATDLSNPENDVFELVWENGHVLSSKTRKNSNFNTRFRDRDTVNGNLSNSKMGKFGTIQLTYHHDGNDDDDDDDLVPWLNYPVNGNLPHQYSSDFLPELSGVTVNEIPSNNTIASSSINEGGSGGNQVVRDTHLNSVEYGNVSKLSSLSSVGTTRSRSSTNHLYSSASQQCQASFPHLRTKNASSAGKTTSKAPYDALSGNCPWVPSIPGSSSSAMRQTPSSNSSNIINFSHFLRPAALLKSNLQNHGVTGAGGSSRIGSLGSMDKDCSATSSQPPDPSLIGMRGSIRKESNSCCKNALMPFIDDNNPSEAKLPEKSQAVKQPEVVCLEKSSNKDDHPKQCVDVVTTRELPGGEKAIEHVTAASLCSRYSVEGTSDDPIHNIKRKCHDVEDSEGHSDDVEEESNDVKRATHARGIGFKRSRAAEVHNLSERRRRDRINEKMRALQELIPNCNKVDKASMLDEAIEYLKTLQVQIQIMSMGAGMFMPPMMFHGGMQPMGAPPHMAHYSPMGVGMGMGFGIGVPDMNGGSHGYPIVQGTHFPGQSIPGQTVMHGMPGSNFQVLGIPGQGLHMPIPRAPVTPFSGGPFMSNSCVAVAPLENVGSAAACSSKNVCQNINTPMAPNDDIHTSITPSQANEQASYVNGMAVTSTSKDNLIPN